MRFCTHIPNSQEHGEAHWFFWPSKLYCPPWAHRKKNSLSTFNVMILQMVRNECVRFGGHVDMEVSYKILRFENTKRSPTFS
jgi:hypothetical protein